MSISDWIVYGFGACALFAGACFCLLMSADSLLAFIRRMNVRWVHRGDEILAACELSVYLADHAKRHGVKMGDVSNEYLERLAVARKLVAKSQRKPLGEK